MVTTCSIEGDLQCWEWDVNPLTREPEIPKGDLTELQDFLDANHFVLHNTKFDYLALESIGLRIPSFEFTQDTLIASHVLASAESHNLKDLGLQYCDILNDDEEALHAATVIARRYGKKYKWRTAQKDVHDPHFPAATKDWVKMDMWTPRAMAKAQNLPPDHPYWTLCRTYGILDAERTMACWLIMEEGLKEEGLTYQYEQRRKLLEVTYTMESHGITLRATESQKVKKDYRFKSNKAELAAKTAADHKIDNLDSYQQLSKILFDHFKLEPTKQTKAGNPSTDKDVIKELSEMVEGKPLDFLTNLQDFRGYTTAWDYLNSYKNFGVELKGTDFWSLYPSFNITGTKTTRFSCNNPNAQNISKKERTNLRKVFGPAPGREWWSIDYSNIEMRIFGYASGDEKLIGAFESGESVHLIFSEILFPKEFAECRRKGWSFKDKYESTLYQWTKNGNFSLIYGAGVAKANRTYHVDNAYHIIRSKLPLIDEFMRLKDHEARSEGFITTLGGYRLQVPEKKPHAAVNYFVQGSAGWAMIMAMIRVFEYLRTLGPEYKMTMTVHDELDFDFPVHKDPNHNLRIIYHIKQLMELSGEDIGIPVPVDVERHAVTWAVGERIKDWSVAL
jgi:DNA polymerase I-like protein with 3'-5' exonuclease and polymerase domains